MSAATIPPLLFKALNDDGAPCHGGSGAWPLPTADGPGAWREVAGPLEPCANGLHLCTLPQLLDRWLGPAIFLAEWEGEIVDDGEKLVARRARLARRLAWDERSARLFACDCAEHVLPLFTRQFPTDARPATTIAVARRFAVGEASAVDLAAAWDAAGAAARAAAGAAARAAAGAAARAAAGAAAWAAAGDVVGDAAWAAAWHAAGAAAWDAASVAERRWQLDRLADALGLTADERARCGLEPPGGER